MKKWLLVLIGASVLISGAVLWHHHTAGPLLSPGRIQMQRLIEQGIIAHKTYHLKYQRATKENLQKYNSLWQQCSSAHPEYFGINLSPDNPSVIEILAHRDDIPAIDKAIATFDSPITATNSAIK